MNGFINRHTNQKSKSISVTTLVFFLLAFFIHVQHIGQSQSQSHKEQSTIGDYQDCHLCQQGVDSPPKLPQLSTIFRENFALVIFNVIAVFYTKNAYVNPQLRAPPTSQ